MPRYHFHVDDGSPTPDRHGIELPGVAEARAEAVSAEVHRFGRRDDAFAFVFDLLMREGLADRPGSYAVWADCPMLREQPKTSLAKDYPGLKFDVTRTTAADAKVGISQMDFGIADTGTLVQDATAVEGRLASTLPSIHVALLETANIVPNLATAITRVDPNRGSYISMITGPSRTADIERVLTIGVHGPERLVIVCVDEAGQGE